jgi:small conductance mechanosensitive channel
MPDVNLSANPINLHILLKIGIFFAAALVVSILSTTISRRLLGFNRFAPRGRQISVERQHTLQALVSNGIAAMAILIAILASLGLFVPVNTIVWIVGLFSTAFSLAARPMVSDVLAGLSFIFYESFDIGEKVEYNLPGGNIQGVVERVNLVNSQLRAPTGELYTVPNGEIRVVRNFTRGKFSIVSITLAVSAGDLSRTLDALKALGEEIYQNYHGVIEPWQVLSNSELSGGKVALTVMAKAVFGQAPEVKLELTNRITDCLKQTGIEIQ